ncbi:hypothetical protein [Kitasatospora sp. NPDC050463]|uniref:hypothetical protein n=1 Tax=Kitasatospora sp. NPDC050463 TaxID=3155786 RepID=UPI0033C94ABB
MPSLRIVEAYARACGADLRTARAHWKAARWAEQKCLHKENADATTGYMGSDITASLHTMLATLPQLIDTFGPHDGFNDVQTLGVAHVQPHREDLVL